MASAPPRLLFFFLIVCSVGLYFVVCQSSQMNEYAALWSYVAVTTPGLMITEEQTSAAAATLRIRPSKDKSFAACLLWMDDNHRLVEWLAYHSYVLPLTYLIIMIDPRSVTSPKEILERYSEYVQYEQWSDTTIGFRAMIMSQQDLHLQHENRQRIFYRECSVRLQDQNYSWATYHDTDEFISLHSNFTTTGDEEYGSIMNHMVAYPERFQDLCLGVPRTLYGSEEDNSSSTTSVSSIPDDISLDTLRYNRHAQFGNTELNGVCKNVMDLSRIPSEVIRKKSMVNSVHRLYQTICPSVWKEGGDLTIAHYIGSWEAYSYRNDARRGQKRTYGNWQNKALSEWANKYTESPKSAWLEGFRRYHGEERAMGLLKGAGLPKNYTNTDYEKWSGRDFDISEFVDNKTKGLFLHSG